MATSASPHLFNGNLCWSSFSLSSSSFPPFLQPLPFTTCCSRHPAHSEPQTSLHPNLDVPFQKKKRKPKPSFYDQIRDKWSVKPISHTQKFPWQLPQQQQNPPSPLSEASEYIAGVETPPFSGLLPDGDKIQQSKPISGFATNADKPLSNIVSDPVDSASVDNGLRSAFVDKKKSTETKLVSTYRDNYEKEFNFEEFDGGLVNGVAPEKLVESNGNVEKKTATIGLQRNSKVTLPSSMHDVDNGYSLKIKADSGNFVKTKSTDRLPWIIPTDSDKTQVEERKKKSKTELAEKLIPEHELKRLRNVALRMKERLQVGAAGVTQALVDTIHDKWKIDEVVKLKFQGPSTFHMRRIHQVLESKTGGLVIWRSGNSVVLFRGLAYKLDCVRSYTEVKKANLDISHNTGKCLPDSVGLQNKVSEEESVEMSELNNLLDELGPRYVDWSGPPPLPVDADLLPAVVPGYKTPFRLLPYGVRRHLRDEETTKFRRNARITHPHFALGRNRELQGLAAAMVKLWEKSAVAKVAIKRGVLNTCNERMAEELKRLTGGTLLSRNKEYLVFYRGNDFLPPNVTESLKERERMTMLQYQEEEERRSALDLVNLNSKKYKVPMVAGTLAETVAATSRWGRRLSTEDVEKLMKDSVLARRASLVTHLQKKLAVASLKLKMAEKALEKVHGYLEPEELPTDLETITDEERLVFRKMGLSMKPYLLLGRREVFDGTIENIHLHWKFRELVKVIVKGKNFGQVKHVAISLEAESGGVLVSIDKTTKGYAIIIYRGKNYRQPHQLRPRNLLTRRQALARSIELQRREGLKHHIASLQEQMELLKSDIKDMNDGKEVDDKTFREKMDDASITSNDDMEVDVAEEAYLVTYDSGDENGASLHDGLFQN